MIDTYNGGYELYDNVGEAIAEASIHKADTHSLWIKTPEMTAVVQDMKRYPQIDLVTNLKYNL